MAKILIILLFLFFVSCDNSAREERGKVIKKEKKSITNLVSKKDPEILAYYEKNKGNEIPSKSIGAVSKGRMEHGKLLPFYGANFTYFDKGSYLAGRAYVNDKVKNILLASYRQLEEDVPNRHFMIMESANRNGGKLDPHRTHQSGLSVDFMMPLIQDEKPYYDLDKVGTMHYLLAFDNNGAYGKDTTVKVDFNLMARHILILNKKAKAEGMRIAKVILKIEYKDELFATKYGGILKESDIYIVKGLSKLINSLHDEHYHIDFKNIK